MMTTYIISFFATALYFTAGIMQGRSMCANREELKRFIYGIACLAIILHAILLYQWIDVGTGQNLSFFNVLSQLAWMISLILLLIAIFKPVVNLGTILFPLTGLTIVLALLFPGNHVIDIGSDPKKLIYILLSFLAVSLFSIAAVQAILLAVQERLLRRHRPSHFMQTMPPLETMESLLFQMIMLGFILLTIVMFSAVFIFSTNYSRELLQHLFLVMMVWAVFALLIAGRFLFGLRGRLAIRGTLGGVLLLFIAYFSSWLLTGVLF